MQYIDYDVPAFKGVQSVDQPEVEPIRIRRGDRSVRNLVLAVVLLGAIVGGIHALPYAIASWAHLFI